jgi:hypothetical protein
MIQRVSIGVRDQDDGRSVAIRRVSFATVIDNVIQNTTVRGWRGPKNSIATRP